MTDAEARVVNDKDDSVVFYKSFCHMTGDLPSGILLSRLFHYFVVARTMEVQRDGRDWLVRRRDDWRNECGLSPRQYDGASAKLEERGYLETRTWQYDGGIGTHLWLNVPKVIEDSEVAKDELDHLEQERIESKEWSREGYERYRRNLLRSRANLMKPFGGKCETCGEDNVEALRFHHKDGAVKGGRERPLSMTREVKQFPERFALLCKTCHGIAHRGDPNMGGKPGPRKRPMSPVEPWYG